MNWKRCRGVLWIAVLLLLMSGCGASSAPVAYQYGDMFEDEESDSGRSHRGGGGGARYSESAAMPTAPPSPVRARAASPVQAAPEPVMEHASGGASDMMMAESDDGYGGEEAYADEVALSGPGDSEPPPEPAPEAPPEMTTTVEQPSTPPENPSPSDGQQQPEQVDATVREAPLLIYQANMRMAVREVQDKIDEVVEIADEIDGYILRQDDTSVVIRVPARRFREVLERIESLGDVIHRGVSAQDVSDQVRDIRIRLRNAIQMRDRLAELLEQAQTVPESLAIERELERLTEIIELFRGQLASLSERIAFSTITVHFQAIQEDREVPREQFRLPFPWLDQLGLPNLMRLPVVHR